jgi:hypothetical protein
VAGQSTELATATKRKAQRPTQDQPEHRGNLS